VAEKQLLHTRVLKALLCANGGAQSLGARRGADGTRRRPRAPFREESGGTRFVSGSYLGGPRHEARRGHAAAHGGALPAPTAGHARHARVFLSEIKYDVNKVAVSSSLCFAV